MPTYLDKLNAVKAAQNEIVSAESALAAAQAAVGPLRADFAASIKAAGGFVFDPTTNPVTAYVATADGTDFTPNAAASIGDSIPDAATIVPTVPTVTPEPEPAPVVNPTRDPAATI